MVTPAQGDHIFIDYLSDGAGDWQLYDNELITSLNSLKTKPIKLVLNNEGLDPMKIEEINNEKLPSIEESMADGKNQSYKIIKSSKSQLTLECYKRNRKQFQF
ncbi:hypothetical protein [Enterobacter sp. BIDMC92]|uniref:hypothetical protein n=1 Tax=Enterobacter sp. BIDMC92 TaxID=1594172 RepID=UPI001E3BE8D0|nr:hypothetical protein [Enterobacter sp. BIDMC92]